LGSFVPLPFRDSLTPLRAMSRQPSRADHRPPTSPSPTRRDNAQRARATVQPRPAQDVRTGAGPDMDQVRNEKPNRVEPGATPAYDNLDASTLAPPRHGRRRRPLPRRALVRPASTGTGEETAARSPRPLSPGCERPSPGPRRARFIQTSSGSAGGDRCFSTNPAVSGRRHDPQLTAPRTIRSSRPAPRERAVLADDRRAWIPLLIASLLPCGVLTSASMALTRSRTAYCRAPSVERDGSRGRGPGPGRGEKERRKLPKTGRAASGRTAPQDGPWTPQVPAS
jgi:hypothetical protein